MSRGDALSPVLDLYSKIRWIDRVLRICQSRLKSYWSVGVMLRLMTGTELAALKDVAKQSSNAFTWSICIIFFSLSYAAS